MFTRAGIQSISTPSGHWMHHTDAANIKDGPGWRLAGFPSAHRDLSLLRLAPLVMDVWTQSRRNTRTSVDGVVDGGLL